MKNNKLHIIIGKLRHFIKSIEVRMSKGNRKRALNALYEALEPNKSQGIYKKSNRHIWETRDERG